MIDFHCHIDLFEDPYKITRELSASGAYVLSVTTTPKAFPKTSALSKDNDRIRTALGLHPQLAFERQNELPLFDLLLSETRYVGEVGLDGGREFVQSYSVQKKVFQSILNSCSKNGGKIISIHSRHAAQEVNECLRETPNCGTPVMHWFTGNLTELKIAVDQGCWFSVGHPMLRSKKGVAIIERIPRNRILTETDAPFTGVDISNSIKSSEEKLSQIWSIPLEDVSHILHCNLKELVS